jgi:hypothetical protein
MKKNILYAVCFGFIVGAGSMLKLYEQQMKERNNKEAKLNQIVSIQTKWLAAYQNKHMFHSYFQKNNLRHIAVYGYGRLGERLVNELVNSKDEVKCVIDKRKIKSMYPFPFITPNMDMQEIDVIVLTIVQYPESMIKELSDKYNCKVISLEDIFNWYDMQEC